MPRIAHATSLLLAVIPAFAAPKKAAPKEAPVQFEGPAVLESINALLQKWRCGALDPAKCPVKTAPTVALEGFRWNSSKREVLEVYTRGGGIIDQKYDPQLRTVSPGSKMQAIEAQREEERVLASQLFTEFDDKHTGYDATFLWKSREYSYANGESLLEIRSGLGIGAIDARMRRFFFFFGGKGDGQRLWKIYEELPLGANSPFGTDFQDAVNKLAATFGVMGRLRAAGQGEGVASTQIDWQDDVVHVRLVERPDAPNVVTFVLEDRRTLESLASLRSNKGDDPFALDPSVAGATTGGISDPTAERAGGVARPEAPKDAKKKTGKR